MRTEAREGPRQRLRARARALGAGAWLGLVLGALAVALAGPAPETPAAVACVALLASVAVGERLAWLLRRLAVAGLAGLGVVALHLALARGAEAARALELGAVLAARMAAGMAVFGLFTALTPPWALVRALRGLGMPAALADVVGLAVRYASVLERSARTAREAQTMRRGYEGVGRGLRSLGELGGLTLVRAFDQAQATSEAMAARGCRGGLVPDSRQGPP